MPATKRFRSQNEILLGVGERELHLVRGVCTARLDGCSRFNLSKGGHSCVGND